MPLGFGSPASGDTPGLAHPDGGWVARPDRGAGRQGDAAMSDVVPLGSRLVCEPAPRDQQRIGVGTRQSDHLGADMADARAIGGSRRGVASAASLRVLAEAVRDNQ